MGSHSALGPGRCQGQGGFWEVCASGPEPAALAGGLGGTVRRTVQGAPHTLQSHHLPVRPAPTTASSRKERLRFNLLTRSL